MCTISETPVTTDIIITVNSEGRIETVNRGAEHALEYRREELIGEQIEMRIDTAAKPGFFQRLKDPPDLGVDEADRDTFRKVLQDNFATIFPSSDTTSGEAVDAIVALLEKNESLSKYVAA